MNWPPEFGSGYLPFRWSQRNGSKSNKSNPAGPGGPTHWVHQHSSRTWGSLIEGGRLLKILVLGGDGFCGWPTALYLSARDHDVVIVDNLSRRNIDNELEAFVAHANPADRRTYPGLEGGKRQTPPHGYAVSCSTVPRQHFMSEQ
jgi:hypothetical protein